MNVCRVAIVTSVLASLASAISGAYASDTDIFTPPSKPATTSTPTVKKAPPKRPAVVNPMIGTWLTVMKGSFVCSFGTGTISIAPDKEGGIRGHADFEGFPGDFKTIGRTGNSIHFAYSYTDSFGSQAVVTYDGTLSSDGNSVSGGTGGTWDDGCTFRMTRQ